MTPKVVWLFIFVVLYWGYCIFWGIRGARLARTASDYFIAGRKLSLWVFVLAATATSYSGWTFMGHPGLVYRDGFQYAFASFYAIAIPFTGVIFLKRQWMLGKRFGYVTPGEMLADYFQGDAIRVLSVVVALFYSIPYLGVQLGASGYMFNVLTATPAYPNGLVGEAFGMWVLSLVVLIYVASGGLRAVAYVDTVQCVLLWLGIVIVGIIALNAVGGWDALNNAMSRLAQSDVGRWGTTQGVSLSGGDYNAYFAVPGVIQWTAGLGKETPIGGIWTGVMILTYMSALMGIQAAPAFTMWAFSNTNPAPFAPQAVWASAAWIGGTLVFFTTFQGMAAHFLGANPLVTSAGLAIDPTLIPAAVAQNPGRARAPLLQPDRRQHAVAGGVAGGVRAGGDAVHRCGLHVHRRRHSDARPLQALPQPRRHARHPKAVRPARYRLHRCLRAVGCDLFARRAGAAGRSRGGLRLPDVGAARGGLLHPVDHPGWRHLGPGRRPGHRGDDRFGRADGLRGDAAMGSVAADHPLGGLGDPVERWHLRDRLGADAGEPPAQPTG